MKRYNVSTYIMANPTIQTQKKVIATIKNQNKPISVTALAKESKSGFNETKICVEFFSQLGILEVITTTSNGTYIQLKKGSDTNEPMLK